MEVVMHEFRRASVFGLVWLAVGVCCAYAADGDKNPDEAETITIPLDQIRCRLRARERRAGEPPCLRTVFV